MCISRFVTVVIVVFIGFVLLFIVILLDRGSGLYIVIDMLWNPQLLCGWYLAMIIDNFPDEPLLLFFMKRCPTPSI